MAAAPAWEQIYVGLPPASAESIARQHLGPMLTHIEHSGAIGGWWFVRKGHWWRLRYHPTGTGQDARTAIIDALTSFTDTGLIEHWVDGIIYEPETFAFGGDEATGIAHRLFYQDSLCFLDMLSRNNTAAPALDRRKEVSLLLCSMLMRSAGLEWFEIGDVWARVVDARPDPTADPSHIDRLKPSLARFLTADVGPDSTVPDEIGFAASWLTAFHQAGDSLRRLHDAGKLQRGLRSVLAHHVIFHQNRIGVPYEAQARLARAARDLILIDRPIPDPPQGASDEQTA